MESLIRGKTVAVTGAGGAIGSGSCRWALSFSPSKLPSCSTCPPRPKGTQQAAQAAPEVAPVLMNAGERLSAIAS